MGFIYKIEIGEDLYIGSTKQKYLCNRQRDHNKGLNNPNCNYYNSFLYTFCREKKVNKIICELLETVENNKLLLLEQEYIKMLEPSLNTRKAYQTKKELKNYKSNFYKKQKTNCPICNKEMRKSSIKKHINTFHKTDN